MVPTCLSASLLVTYRDRALMQAQSGLQPARHGAPHRTGCNCASAREAHTQRSARNQRPITQRPARDIADDMADATVLWQIRNMGRNIRNKWLRCEVGLHPTPGYISSILARKPDYDFLHTNCRRLHRFFSLRLLHGSQAYWCILDVISVEPYYCVFCVCISAYFTRGR